MGKKNYAKGELVDTKENLKLSQGSGADISE